jgi:hypothetical protein
MGLLLTMLCFVSIGGSFTGCSRSTRWRAVDTPKQSEIARLLDSPQHLLLRDESVAAVPDIPLRERLRPCCVFGADVRVRVGALPIPGYRVGNIIDPSELGPHHYDSGLLIVAGSGVDELVSSENNGLVYSCRGGFIDTAHVRDYADWTIFIASQICLSLEEGITIELPPEGGKRTLVFKPIDEELIQRHGRKQLTIALAQWSAFQLSIWHEMATWAGWSWSAAFPESVSAFSPEDLYSNMIGIRIAGALALERSARTDDLFNRSMDAWLTDVLAELGATPKKVALEAMYAVDGVWWNSGARLPDDGLVLRRNLDMETELTPWLVTRESAAQPMHGQLGDMCGDDPQPLVLSVPNTFHELSLRTLARLEIAPSRALRRHEPFDDFGRVITHDNFPAILNELRQQILEALGPDALRAPARDLDTR